MPRIISLSFKNVSIDVVNKNTKIWLNYTAGGAISIFLLWSLYGQVSKQLGAIDGNAWKQTGASYFLYLCIGLMFVNVCLEGYKWCLLTRSVESTSYPKALASYLVGIAFSIITPNRVGDYPGRILYLGRSNTFRYVNVSILGVMSQLSAIFIWGFVALIYYNIAFPALIAKVALGLCIIVNICLITVYWRFEAWLPALERFRWLRRFALYGRLLNRMDSRRQLSVLGISLLRFAIFTAQYLFLLRWMNVAMPLAAGFCMAALFFWVMAVIPSIAFTGLVARVHISEYLFHHFSPNTVGIVAATAGIWLLNLIVPSVAGSILMIRMRLLR